MLYMHPDTGQPMLGRFVQVYCDDILVFSEDDILVFSETCDSEEHHGRTRVVLETLC